MANYDDFGDFTEWYDLIYENEGPQADIDFYMKYISQKSNATVLEMGSGSGRVLKCLAEKGIYCTGIEISDGMIKKAKDRLADLSKNVPKPEIIKGDITSTKLNRKFDFVIYPYSILFELEGDEAAKSALKNGYDHLADYGLMMIDNAYHGVWKDDNVVKFKKATRISGNEDIFVNIFESRKRNQKTLETTINLFIDQFGKDIPLTRKYFEINKRFYLAPEKLKDFLSIFNFNKIDVYGGYNLAPFEPNEDAGRQLWVCKKNNRLGKKFKCNH